ncbi:hypothetical protein [Aquimarina algiphila]|uniref:hypothetical protein n=1 Tax=Aquimarina algiphila TaxID=2047982 RepID=UPI00232E8B05|nr:hypothetical protein [Aquimarina algiphila]
MKKILIPTDFSIKSLKLAEYAFNLYPKEIVNLILVYPYRLPVWEGDLYRFSSKEIIAELNSEEFSKAKNELVNRYYININSILIELFIGVNSYAFNNFRDEHQIQIAVVPQKGDLDFSHNSTFDPLYFILKNVPKVYQINLTKEEEDWAKQY